MITLHLEPNTPPLTMEGFVKEYPTNSIAIDGFVSGPPQFVRHGVKRYLNLNHHEGVARLETRATCAQALMMVRQRLFHFFVDGKGSPDAQVFANDCDEDVCLTWFVLRHHYLVEPSMNPMLNRLVF